MATIAVRDATGTTRYIKASEGDGTSGNPFILDRISEIYHNDAIVSTSNRLPVDSDTDLSTVESSLSTIDGKLNSLATSPTTYTETQLTAPGTTTSRDARGRTLLTFYLTVSSIDTSVTVRPEGSPDNSSWFPLGEDYTITANGGDMLTFAYEQPLTYVRLNFVSEAGGTAATLDVITVLGGRA